ncbi:MAG: hypothetical protein QOE00_1065, partial [Ilumatobacteraceae bacterium]
RGHNNHAAAGTPPLPQAEELSLTFLWDLPFGPFT